MTEPTTPGAELRARADETGGEVSGVAVPAVAASSTPLADDATALPDEAAEPVAAAAADATTTAALPRPTGGSSSTSATPVEEQVAPDTAVDTKKTAPAAAVTPVTAPPAPAVTTPAPPVRHTAADLQATAEDDMGKKDGAEADSVVEARRAVEATRSELADTVEALAAKADVKGRATAKADEVRADVTAKASANPVPFIAAGATVLALLVLRVRSRRSKKKKR